MCGVLVLTGSVDACAPQPQGQRPLRSPTRDYPAPPPQTSDGEVVGADRRSPADALVTGPTNEGLAPGWKLDDGKPSYEPGARVGGATEHDAVHDDHDNQPDAKKKPAAPTEPAASGEPAPPAVPAPNH